MAVRISHLERELAERKREIQRICQKQADADTERDALRSASAPIDPESEAANPVWDLVIQACAKAWGPRKLAWNNSPIELIIDIINERDDLLKLMECDDIEEAIEQVKSDIRLSLEAAEAIKKAARSSEATFSIKSSGSMAFSQEARRRRSEAMSDEELLQRLEWLANFAGIAIHEEIEEVCDAAYTRLKTLLEQKP